MADADPETPGTPLLTQETLRSLSFVHYLHRLGIDQSRQPYPMGMACVLTFHDAVELFLYRSADVLQAKVKTDTQFMAYFEEVDRRLPMGRKLSGKVRMNRLNKWAERDRISGQPRSAPGS